MAQIDTSIYNQLKPVQIENPLAQYAQLAQVQSAQNQNKLAELAYGEKQREIAGENALAGLVSSGKKGDEVFTGLAGQGYGKQAMAYRKQEADRVKADAELKGLNLGNQGKEFELGEKKRIAGIQKNAALLTNPNFSYDMFVNHVQQSVANKEVAPEAAQAFIQQAPQDPAQLKAFLTQQLLSSLSPEKQLEASQPKTEFKDTGGQIVAIQNNPNLPGYGKPIQGADLKKTQSPDSVASVAASIRGQDVSASTTRRGQDMTDARTREFNDTKVEENKIKREAKDETANLTKSSQVASFDTMLGTLDRLSKHPGLSRSVGAIGAFPTMPGSDSANFQAELNTFQSQAFLPMVAQLKGMGALSDAEGKKLTAAVGALDPKMGEKAFRESVSRITADMESARKRMVGGASKSTPKVSASEPAAAGIISVTTAEDYAKVPSGATYTTPDGSTRRKP